MCQSVTYIRTLVKISQQYGPKIRIGEEEEDATGEKSDILSIKGSIMEYLMDSVLGNLVLLVMRKWKMMKSERRYSSRDCWTMVKQPPLWYSYHQRCIRRKQRIHPQRFA